MNFTGPNRRYMNTLEQISADLQERHKRLNSWRLAADPYPINKAMARMIANGYEPGNRVRRALKIAPIASVVVIGDGEVPEGAQVISALLCDCGQWFISNHPRRKRCFICSPYKHREPA